MAGWSAGSAQPLSTPFHDFPSGAWSLFHTPQTFLEVRSYAFADTNVRPLFREEGAAEFNARRAYLQSALTYAVRWRTHAWEFSLAYGQANRYEGNSGAARLFLEAEQGRLSPDTRYPVEATLNRSAVHIWTATYHGAWNASPAKGRYWVGVSYLHLQRVQQGWLQGQKAGNSFEGELTLLTTRGLPASAIRGEGYALSAGVALNAGNWTAGVSAHNLWSRLRVRQAQRIEATVRMNQLTPDADGFLRAPPALEGSVNPASLQRLAQPRVDIEVWRRLKGYTLGILAVHERDWQGALALRRDGSRSSVQVAYWQPRPMVWLIYEQSDWRAVLGADLWNGDRIQRFYVGLTWRWEWGRQPSRQR